MAVSRTVLRSVEILRLLAEKIDGLTLKDICSSLDLPKTSAFDIVQALVAGGMIQELRQDGLRYVIGLGAFQVGSAFLKNTDLVKAAEPHVRDLAEALEKTAFIAVYESGEVTYLYKFEPEQPIITTSNIGTKNPAHCTSLGKAILSGMSPARLDEAMGWLSFEPRTSHTITNADDLRKNLALAARLGYAVDNREIDEHTLCIGAPVFDYRGEPVAAVSISGFDNGKIDVESEGATVRQAASRISTALGYGGSFYG